MTRIRTHNRRRLNRVLKQGGLYTLRYRPSRVMWWAESDAPVSITPSHKWIRF